MQNPPCKPSSDDFRSSYQRYKALSNTFITWLLSTYEDLNSSVRAAHRNANRSSKPTVADFERFAVYIADCPRYGREKVPRSILNCLYKIIQRRSEASLFYSQRADSDISSNQTHVHFIRVLERMFDTLGGDTWIQDHLDQRREQVRKMEEQTSVPLCDKPPVPNRFFAFTPHSEDPWSLSDDEEDENDSWLPDQSSSSDSKPGKGRRRRSSATARQSKKRFWNSFPDFSLGEDESDERFTQFCFFDDLNMLRKHVGCIWNEWAAEPTLKGLVVAATATDVAVRVAEDLESRFIGHDPSLTGVDAQSMQEALLSFDGMVRASEDWTIGIMNPYYAAMSETKTDTMAGHVVESQALTRVVRTGLPNRDTWNVDTHSKDSSENATETHQYWGPFMSRMAGEMSASSSHPLLHPGESTLTQLMRGGPSLNTRNYISDDVVRRPRLKALVESVDSIGLEDTSETTPTESGAAGNQSTILSTSAMPKPCLIFAAQVYLDIDRITLGVDFPYQHAVTLLGKKIYTYMNWLSCQTLKRHIKTLALTPSMDIFPVTADMPEVRDRGPYASMSLAPRGVWQEGMGDFGRIVGVKISRDVGAEVTRGTIARVNPNRDATLSPWSWGSRAMHILAESLRFGAKAYNEGGMFITVAHIYNAFRETCPSLSKWTHMESFLAIHGDDIFNGRRPTKQQAQCNSPEFFYNRWRLRMGLSVHEFSKGKKTGQFTKRQKGGSSRSNYSTHGCQVANPEVYGPTLSLQRPKLGSSRNTDGISKDVLAVRLVEKKMHLDAESMKLLSGTNSHNHAIDLGYLVTTTKERLEDDMAKMSRNLFAMEAFCQRVIERVINSVPREVIDGFLESCGVTIGGAESSRWEIRENLPVFAASVLLLLETYHPLQLAWLDAFAAIAEENEDAGFVLLHKEAVLPSVDPARVEEVVE